jgi:predicted DNA binding CopG/RHH family protein
MAHATGQKDQRINIRLSRADLASLRARALQLGMPYQTLISSVLHRYAIGELKDGQRG